MPMKIMPYSNARANHFDGGQVKGVTGRVLLGREDGAEKFCMRLFEIAPGGYTPKHSHDWEHEIFVHSGEGTVFNGGEWVPVSTGTVLFIPPNEEHQLKNVAESPFVFVCLIPSGPPEI
jgi:quercetin dioxygenase-like cupin family protein